MSIFDEVVTASYAGVQFLMDRSSIDGGRKDALKEFPNSNLQVVEDLGLRPRSFNIEAVISQDSNGENYIQRRDNFLRVLEKGGKDVLIHPLYGRINNVVVRSFSLIESFISLGEAKFSISFAISDTDGTPIAVGDTLSVVNNSVVNSISNVNNYLIENFNVSSGFPANFSAAVEKVNDIADAFEKNTSFLQVTAEGIDSFTEQLVEFRSNVASLVSSPNGLINSIDRLFSTVNEIYDDTQSTFEVMQRFFVFGDSDENSPIETDTSGKIERARNQNLLNNLVKSQSLLLNYENASEIEFTTVSQVEEFESILENQYQSVILNSDFDQDTLLSISDTRTQVQKLFDAQRLNSRNLVDIKTVTLPSRVISYQYYGDSSQGFNIAELNEDVNVSFIEGNIQVFTE